MLVVGLALIYIAVHVTKDAIDRPRPTGSARGRRAAPPIRAATPRTRRRGWPPRWCSPGGLRLVTSGILVFVALGIAAAGRRSRASTCARTGGPTSRAAGASAPPCSRCSAQSSWSSSTFATMGRGELRAATARGTDGQHRPVHHRDRLRPGGRAHARLLRGADPRAGHSLLRARLGEARRRRPDAVRARHARSGSERPSASRSSGRTTPTRDVHPGSALSSRPSTRSRTRSSRVPACPPWRGRRAGPSTRA